MRAGKFIAGLLITALISLMFMVIRINKKYKLLVTTESNNSEIWHSSKNPNCQLLETYISMRFVLG
jgi:hypothetical protein